MKSSRDRPEFLIRVFRAGTGNEQHLGTRLTGACRE
jgi:hypothetical protein